MDAFWSKQQKRRRWGQRGADRRKCFPRGMARRDEGGKDVVSPSEIV